MSAVVRNLENVLNAVKCYGSVVQDYGLGDYDGVMNTADSLATLRREIDCAVRSYEKRIHDPKVDLLGRDAASWIHFDLSGRVAGRARRLRLRFHAVRHQVLVSEEGRP